MFTIQLGLTFNYYSSLDPPDVPTQMANFKSVDELDNYLLTRSYITGYSLSNDDKVEFNKLSGPPSQATHPNGTTKLVMLHFISFEISINK